MEMKSATRLRDTALSDEIDRSDTKKSHLSSDQAAPTLAVDRPQSRLPVFLSPGSVVDGRYRIESFLGAGGMCEVYKAFHLQLMKPVALKMLRPTFAGGAADVFRFQREAIALAALKHPNVVQVYGFGQFRSRFQVRPYIALEYVEGCTLTEYVNRQPGKCLSREQAMPLIAQICDALDAAHQKGMIHRDLKPGNIMIDPDGRSVKLLDFGIVKMRSEDEAMGRRLSQTGQTIGSATHMSPEQISGLEIDCRSDIYALGCVIYDLLTGNPPFLGSSAFATMNKHLHETPPELTSVNDEFEMVVKKALAKAPDDRPQTVLEFKQALLGAAAGVNMRRGQQGFRKLTFIGSGLAAACLTLFTLQFLTPSVNDGRLVAASPQNQQISAPALLDQARAMQQSHPAQAISTYIEILNLRDRAPSTTRAAAIFSLAQIMHDLGYNDLCRKYSKELELEFPAQAAELRVSELTASGV